MYFAHACIMKLTRNTGGYLYMVSKIVLSLLFGMMSAFFVFSSPASTKANWKESNPLNLEAKPAADYNFDNEKDIDPSNKFKVKAYSSTLTNSGQSFSLVFSTGGQGWWDMTKTWLLAPNDDNYDDYMSNTFNKYTQDERNEIKDKYEKAKTAYDKVKNDESADPNEVAALKEALEELEGPHFKSYVFSLYGQKSYPEIYIPRSLTRNYIFDLDVGSIGAEAISDWKNVKEVHIPVEVAEIYSNTFINVPNTVTFYCEAEEKPHGWADDWAHEAKVEWNSAYPDDDDITRPLGVAGADEFGNQKENYILGWYPKEGEGEAKPLIAEYKVKGSNQTEYFEFSPSKAGRTYECVGYEISSFTSSLLCDIPLEAGQEVDFSSLVLHNIFATKTNDGGTAIPEPDFTKAFHYKPIQGFNETFHVDQFVSTKFNRFSTFGGYSSINVTMDINKEANIYNVLKGPYYEMYKSDIEKGTVKIRYRLTSLNQDLCAFKFTMEGQEDPVVVPVKTPVKQYVFQKESNNKISFLFKNSDIAPGFNPKKVKSISIVGFYVTVDLMGKKSTIARSSAITRFGDYVIMPLNSKANVFDLNLLTILLLVGYAVIYAAVSVALYFYLKNKYKNDEFRRMKTKSYVFKSILSLVGSAIVIFDFFFIFLRFFVLNNAIVVYNPLDAFIIILSVLSVVIIFYFVKYLVGVVKTNKERRRIIKLKLNEDVEDDGTN